MHEWEGGPTLEAPHPGRAPLEVRDCVTCGEPFSSKPSQKAKYCCRECFYARPMEDRTTSARGESVQAACAACSKPFPVTASRLRRNERQFCSTDCREIGKRVRVGRECRNCGTPMQVKPSVTEAGGGRYCSRTCKYEGTVTRLTFHCLRCSEPFTVIPFHAERGVGVYCSVICRAAAKHEAGTTPCTCLHCGTDFRAHNWDVAQGWGRYCSKECRNDARTTKVERVCEICGDGFLIKKSHAEKGNGRFCGRACHSVHQATDPDLRQRRIKMLQAQLDQKTPTRCELMLYVLMDQLVGDGNWERQHAVFHWVVDAAIPGQKVVIQADGDFWHGKKAADNGGSAPDFVIAAVNRDRSQDAYLAKAGWRILRLWESELLGDPEWCLRRIKRFLSEGQPSAIAETQ